MVEVNGKHFKQFYGMSSGTAMNKYVSILSQAQVTHSLTHLQLCLSVCMYVSTYIYLSCRHAGGVAEYRSSEGKTVMVPYRGPVVDTVHDILGGLRSTCTYVGASKVCMQAVLWLHIPSL